VTHPNTSICIARALALFTPNWAGPAGGTAVQGDLDGPTRMLVVRCTRTDSDSQYAAARNLLGLLGETSGGSGAYWSGNAQWARRVLFGCLDTAPSWPQSLVYRVMKGVYALFVELLAVAPLLLVIEDVQWCDVGTLRCLDFIVRRTARLPLSLLLMQTGPGVGDIGAALTEIVNNQRCRSVAVDESVLRHVPDGMPIHRPYLHLITGAPATVGHEPCDRCRLPARDPVDASAARSHHGLLTDAERRVADLAMAGNSTPEIAATMFLSIRTVEVHLTRIYRKLGISRRGELTRALMGDVTVSAS
jgi:DNA-binding CsgD family transcriptional regulator